MRSNVLMGLACLGNIFVMALQTAQENSSKMNILFHKMQLLIFVAKIVKLISHAKNGGVLVLEEMEHIHYIYQVRNTFNW